MESFQKTNKVELDKMNQAIQSQQQQMDKVLSTIEHLLKAKKDFNTPDGVPSKQPDVTNKNIPDRVVSHSTSQQNAVSIAGSDRWFRSVNGGSTMLSDDSISVDKENIGDKAVLDKDQEYWHTTTHEYEEENIANGEEISSSIASASKIFWHKPLKQEALKVKLGNAAIPSNCKFLLPKRTNKEVWSNMPTYARGTDIKLQETHKCYSASVTMTLRAASKLAIASQNMPDKELVSELMSSLKESMNLAGKTSQLLNQVRRGLNETYVAKTVCKISYG